MSKQRAFRPDGLDALEGRLAPAAIVPAVVTPPAEVDQQGDFQTQSGDQTTSDTAAGTQDNKAQSDGD
jgi:hypothetical protein